MIKLIALIKRKPGLSRQEFVEYYEGNHVPFVSRAAGKYFVDYRRNYVCQDESGGDTGGRLFDQFDVVTEVWIQDRAALDTLLSMMTGSPWAEELIADEDKFIDRPSMRMFVTEEYRRPGEGSET